MPTADRGVIANPYNFSSPVKEEALFSGRRKQFRDIKYYISQAKVTAHPINLALLGERASGKTSYLNMIQLEALREGFCVTRLDLNETDVSSTGTFFSKLVEELFFSAIEQTNGTGEFCFGGRSGKTYEAYTDLISQITESPDPLFLPLSTPVIAARQRRQGGTVSAIPEAMIRNDLNAIRDELGKPVSIIIDECDLLSRNRGVLQMLRNIFMATRGFQLVFAGTPSLFPAMDDVFSPVARQFKKISIEPFDSEDETEECVLDPLKRISSEAVPKYLGQNFDELVRDIHEIAGGRPYEIQLMCFFMFKNVQLGAAPRLALSKNVIEEVRKELDIRHDLVTRPLVNVVDELNHDDFRALRLLLSVGSPGTARDAWNIERFVASAIEMPLEQLRGEQKRLEQKGLFEPGDAIVFKGDDVDRLYLKYCALSQDVRLPDVALPPSIRLAIAVIGHFGRRGIFHVGSTTITDTQKSDEHAQIKRIVDVILDGSSDGLDDIVDENIVSVWRMAYALADETTSLDLLNVSIKGDKVARELMFFSRRDPLLSMNYDLKQDLESMKLRGAEVGLELNIDFARHPIPKASELSHRVKHLSQSARRKIAEHHHTRMERLYVAENKTLALSHAEMCYTLDNTHLTTSLGYVFLAHDDLARASVVFEALLEKDPGDALALYDLAMTEIKKENNALSRSYLKRCEESAISADDLVCLRMLVPILMSNGHIGLEERKTDLTLRGCLETAIAVMDCDSK